MENTVFDLILLCFLISIVLPHKMFSFYGRFVIRIYLHIYDIYIYIYIYIYMCVCVCVCVYMYSIIFNTAMSHLLIQQVVGLDLC